MSCRSSLPNVVVLLMFFYDDNNNLISSLASSFVMTFTSEIRRGWDNKLAHKLNEYELPDCDNFDWHGDYIQQCCDSVNHVDNLTDKSWYEVSQLYHPDEFICVAKPVNFDGKNSPELDEWSRAQIDCKLLDLCRRFVRWNDNPSNLWNCSLLRSFSCQLVHILSISSILCSGLYRSMKCCNQHYCQDWLSVKEKKRSNSICGLFNQNKISIGMISICKYKMINQSLHPMALNLWYNIVKRWRTNAKTICHFYKIGMRIGIYNVITIILLWNWIIILNLFLIHQQHKSTQIFVITMTSNRIWCC